jgi:4a-hydroxytetrahydrobiopterin dehydratase
MDLASKQCIPCRGGVPPLESGKINELHGQLDPGWKVIDDHHLSREYRFDDFAQALAFVNRVGEIAEREGHHPDIYFTWGKARIDIWTHKIDGLTESDFILAAKIG